MFKKILLALIALCLMLVTVGVRAEANSRVFAKAGADGWPALEAQLEKDGFLKEDTILIDGLVKIAYLAAKKREIVPSGVNDDEVFPEFVLAFRQLNGLGDTITIAEFKALATGNGIYLPEYRGAVPAPATAEPRAEAPKASASQVSIAPVADPRVTRLAGELTKLKGEIANARKQAESADKALVTRANENLAQLNQQLVGIQGQLTKLPSSAKVDEVAKQVEILLRGLNEVELMQAEQGTSISWLWLSVSGTALIAIAGFGLSLIGNRRVSTVKKETKVAIADVVERIEVVEAEVGRLDIKIADNLAERLEATQIGRECNFSIEVEDTRFSLLATRVEEGYVTLTGVRDQQNKVAIAKVVSVLKKAARQGRIQGIASLTAVA